MNFTQEEINEFNIEAGDLLDSAEKALLQLDDGVSLKTHYDSVFRTFHSLKGAAGMMEFVHLQKHMHELEHIFLQKKDDEYLSKDYIDFFLKGCDVAKQSLAGVFVSFDYNVVKAKSLIPVPAQVSIPVQSSVETVEPSKVIQLPKKNENKKKSNGRALIVDDEAEIVDILKEILHDFGFETLGTTKSEEAVALIREFNPDVVLSDISMPKLDGMGLLKSIRQVNSKLPVIFISGNVSKDFLVESIGNGIFAVMEKPFNTNQVVQACLSAVRSYQTDILLQKTFDVLIGHFSDIDSFLVLNKNIENSDQLRKDLMELYLLKSKQRLKTA
jgi:DNA-binding response OmpR family regulator/HPt (histidine-containing phosphotransfer) domain-containing protein